VLFVLKVGDNFGRRKSQPKRVKGGYKCYIVVVIKRIKKFVKKKLKG